MIRLTNEQWERIRNHFPEEHIPDGRPGRKPIPTRHVFEAVLWILNTGAQWHMLPQSYPNYKSVHRRFQTWCRDEVLRRVLMDVANELRDKGALDEAECFIDATFVMAKGGGADVGATKRGKGIASCPLRAPGCRLKLRPRLQSKQHPRDECSGRSRFASRGPTARQLLVLRIPDQRPMTRKRAAAHGGKAIQSGFFNDACGSD